MFENSMKCDVVRIRYDVVGDCLTKYVCWQYILSISIPDTEAEQQTYCRVTSLVRSALLCAGGNVWQQGLLIRQLWRQLRKQLISIPKISYRVLCFKNNAEGVAAFTIFFNIVCLTIRIFCFQLLLILIRSKVSINFSLFENKFLLRFEWTSWGHIKRYRFWKKDRQIKGCVLKTKKCIKTI